MRLEFGGSFTGSFKIPGFAACDRLGTWYFNQSYRVFSIRRGAEAMTKHQSMKVSRDAGMPDF